MRKILHNFRYFSHFRFSKNGDTNPFLQVSSRKTPLLSDTLLVGPDEKRIMASVEKTRANHLRRCAAAKLIQCSWRQYHFKRLLMIAEQKHSDSNASGKKQRRLTLFKHLHRLRESHVLERDFSEALWQWRQVKHSTNNVDNSLGKYSQEPK